MKIQFNIMLFPALILLVAAVGLAQIDERKQAIALFQQGKDAEAAAKFKRLLKQSNAANDAELHNFLGLSLLNIDKVKDARGAFEKAVELKPENSVYHSNLAFTHLFLGRSKQAKEHAEKAVLLEPRNAAGYSLLGQIELWDGKLGAALSSAEKAIAANPNNAQGYLLKSDVLMASMGRRIYDGSNLRTEIDLLYQSKTSLTAAIEKIGKGPSVTALELKLQSVNAFYDYYKSRNDPPRPPGSQPEPGVTQVKVIKKPQATYSDKARSAGISGTVRLAVMLLADGRVGHIIKLWGLGYGLDEKAIEAARQIKFQPKEKDGKPVNTVVTIEYSFAIF